MAVVALREWDERVRTAYFDCDRHQCYRPWVIPCGPGDVAAAKEIGYTPHKLDCCPAKAIWSGTRDNFFSPVFQAALRSKDGLIYGRGVLDEPVNLGRFVEVARDEIEAFRQLVAERRSRERRKN